MKDVSILLVGIGGYGENYVRIFLEDNTTGGKVVGAVDPFPDRCSRLRDLKEAGIPVYSTLEEFYSSHTAELAIISSPIHLHIEQSILCMSKGSNVLCEKPLCAVYQDAARILDAQKKYDKFTAIGYQLSYSAPIQELKKDILSGVFGKAVSLKSLIILPRHESYYERNSWAGRLKASNGSWVLDSPVMNSCAHHLHNMFYIMGSSRETSAFPASVQAELYRANPMVENFDTAAIRSLTKDGIEILMYSTQALDAPKTSKVGPYWEFRFENAVVFHRGTYDTDFYVRFNDGSIKDYSSTLETSPFKKLWDVIRAVRTGEKVPCGAYAAVAHVLCINGAQESTEVTSFPKDMVVTKKVDGETWTYARGIQDILTDCFHRGKLPSELGYSFAKPGRIVNLEDYKEFKGVCKTKRNR